MIEVFISKAINEAPMYQAWGSFVASEIMKGILLESEKKESLLKIPVQIRVKKESSIRGKAARYAEANIDDVVKDLVGVRFIVLLSSELNLVEASLEANSNWKVEKVRDYDAQSMKSPELFDYQSIHYLVTSIHNIETHGIDVRSGLTCEVQIRTLLQHAYAELTHDNIYKPTQLVPQKAKRYVARSMALMEATDDLFCRTLDELRAANLPRNEIYSGFCKFFKDVGLWCESKVDERLNLEIIDTYREMIDFATILDQVEVFLENYAFVVNRIKSERNGKFLFEQPVIFLIYYLVEAEDYKFRKLWRLDSLFEQLRLVYSDLGIALADRL